MSEQSRKHVIVVGSGLSGSSAALHASRQGARVTILEKSAQPGGSTALSAGMFWTAPDLEAYRKRIPLGRVDLAERLMNEYETAVAELRAMNVRVADEPMHEIMTFGIGFSTDIHGILQSCWDAVVAGGGELVTNAPVVDLVIDDNRVVGVVTRAEDGTLGEYRGDAVTIATGGFQGDRSALAQYLGPNAQQVQFRSNPGSTGDGLRLAQSAGADRDGAMDTFYGHLLPYPLERFEAENFLPYSQYYSGHCILLNQNGERFSDETVGDEILNQDLAREPGALGVLIFDDHVRRTEATSEPFPGLGAIDRVQIAADAGGRYASADSLESLLDAVAEWGIDRRRLQDTVDGYLAAVAAGGDAAAAVPVSAAARAPQTGPFHALMVQPSITFTFGGIRTDASGAVIDHRGERVPGLFAAGADIGGVSNHGYAGGLAPAYITGRWAGLSASGED
ncbi:FAD-dependent oxidoreductase [Gulosibacter macacae]|uniref:FAD-dependent oxidoreductase n=1 Tax=Gulosibacter macacae TaxID=2488791 RepID=A0A3P3VW56_9MICO|nr:FAD-dependent oxidoreductase [Gulosibacter macacae]RRJ87025.1 FAD-dependent oxidoreductase [Gulosibacter macacae]